MFMFWENGFRGEKLNVSEYKAACLLRRRNLKTHSFISTVRPTAHTNPSRKRSYSKTFFRPEEIDNTGFTFSC